MSVREQDKKLLREESHRGSVTVKNKRDDLDDLLEEIGGCSHFQLRRHVLFFLMSIPFACQNLFMVFAGHNPGMCVRQNLTHCIDVKSFSAAKACPITKHHTFIKDTSFSIVTEFDLVCDRSYLSQMANSAYFIGAVIGSVFIGWIADRFGRKSVLFSCFAIVILISGMSAFANTLWFFVMARCLIGFFLSGFALALYVIAAEVVSPSYRSLSTISLLNYFALALMLLGLKAYLLQNWRHLLLVTTTPYLVFFLLYRYTPESLRWLWSTGQYKRANKTIEMIAKENKKAENLSRFSNILNVDIDNELYCNYLHIFKHPKLLLYTCVLSCISLTTGFIYYGFFLVSDSFSGDIYLDFVLLAAMEIPANFLSLYCTERFGRKKTVIVSLIVACLSSGSLFCLIKTKPSDWRYLNLGIGLFGKVFITTALVSSNVWSCELYPTIVRSKGLGVVTSIRLVGGAGAPWLTTFLIRSYPALPFAVMGALAGFAALLCLLLPETGGMATNETFKDLDELIPARQDMDLTDMTDLKFDYEVLSALDRETVL